MCKERAMEPVLSEIVENISKMDHSVCSVVWHLEDGLTSLKFLPVTKNNEELDHKYLDLKTFIYLNSSFNSKFPSEGKEKDINTSAKSVLD